MENNGIRQISPIIDKLSGKYDRMALSDAVELLEKLFRNITAHPSDVKFRKIKATNKTLASKVFALRGIEELLISLGFRLEGEFYVYNGQDIVRFQQAVIILEAKVVALRSVRTSQISQAERENMAEIEAEKRAEESEKKRLLDGMHHDRDDFKSGEKGKVYTDSKGKKLKFGANVAEAAQVLQLNCKKNK